MTNPKTLKQHCEESPAFGDKLKEVVLEAPFDGVDFRVGCRVRDEKKKDYTYWLRNAYLQGKL